jgi:hypothetical protein
MDRNDTTQEASRYFSDWYKIIDWAKIHFRDRSFTKDERIPTRSGLLYLVERGVLRLVSKGKHSHSIADESIPEDDEPLNEMFLGFIGAGQPFEVVDYLAVLARYRQLDYFSARIVRYFALQTKTSDGLADDFRTAQYDRSSSRFSHSDNRRVRYD